MSFITTFKKPVVIIPVVLVCVVASVYVFRKDTKESVQDVFVVEPSTLIQTVSVTGRVVPSQEVELAFERSGRVESVVAEIGDRVEKGGALVKLDTKELEANLAQAQAGYAVAQATLDEAIRGARPEDIAISESREINATGVLRDAKRSLADTLQQSYTVADDAVRNKTDQFFFNPAGRNPALTFSVTDFQLKTNIENSRFLVGEVLVAWKERVDLVTGGSASVTSLAETCVGYALSVKTYLDTIALAVNALTANSSLSQTVIDSYKSAVSLARTTLNTSIDSLTSARTAVNNAESSLALAQKELLLKRAGSTSESIDAKKAQVAEALAGIKNLEAQLSKMTLSAPFSALVVRQDAKVGEIASANKSVVGLIGVDGFEIEVNVPEADIAKISVGDSATTTLDAYGSDVYFPALVSKIDPAETLVDNVATYKVTLRFASTDARIKSGMTANLEIMTDSRSNVLAVPLRAVKTTTDGKRTVNVLGNDGVATERPVTLGIRAEGGRVEITSGLSAGERVIIAR
jgi:RND family efflux transporter MFP subunit